MSPWWRAYDEAVDDPKLQQLKPELFKAFQYLLRHIAERRQAAVSPVGSVQVARQAGESARHNRRARGSRPDRR
jgi:hypothetical protein